MATIILTGGGSAGHCTPHLALLPYIKNYFNKIYYIGSNDGIEKSIIENVGIPYYAVPCAKLKRKICASNLCLPIKVLSGISKAGAIIDKLKPDVVFSKGGYVSVPTVIAAKRRKIPVIAHESDYTVGLANKITSRCCKKVLTSFPETAKTLKNGEYIGSPIRNSLYMVDKNAAKRSFDFEGKKPVLLITGGSLGSRAINEVVYKSLDNLLKKYDVIHICGKGNKSEITKKGYYQVEFMQNVENAFAISDVCVSRAGSNACFELLSLKIPCVFIPLPKGESRGDQVLNAKYFKNLGLASVLEQNKITASSFEKEIDDAYENRLNLKKNFALHPIVDKSRQISKILRDYSNA